MDRHELSREVEVLLRAETRPRVVAVLQEFDRMLTRWGKRETLQNETLHPETLHAKTETSQEETLQCLECERRRVQAAERLKRHRAKKTG